MADRILATYQDPNWRAQQNQNAGALLALAVQTFQRRREERKQKDLAAVQQFLDFASKNPELAAGPYGAAVKQKYGAQFPELAPMVDSLAQRGQRLNEMESAGQQWLQTADQMAQAHEREKQLWDSQADTIPTGGGPMPAIPNVAKLVKQAELAAYDPNQVYLHAAESLKPSERYAAQAWAKSHQSAFPDLSMGWTPDPGKMSPEIQALAAAFGTSDLTKLRPQVEQLLNLAPREGIQQEITYRTNEGVREKRADVDENIREATAKQGLDIGEAEKKSKLSVSEENLRHAHHVNEVAVGHSASMAEIAARHADDGAASKDKPLSSRLLSWQKESVGEYDKRLKVALEGAPEGAKIKAKKEFIAKEGLRPREMSPPLAKQVESELAGLEQMGLIDPQEKEAVALRVAGRFNALTGSPRPGTKPTVKSSGLFGGTKTETPAPIAQSDPQAAVNEALMDEAIDAAVAKDPTLPQEFRTQARETIKAQFFKLRKAGVPRQEALRRALAGG